MSRATRGARGRSAAAALGAAGGAAVWALLRAFDAAPPLVLLVGAGALLGAMARGPGARRDPRPGETEAPGGGTRNEEGVATPVAAGGGAGGRGGDGEAVELALGDTIDLHSFGPGDVVPVARAFVEEAAERGLPLVRLIHGKGRGVQRAAVHRMLAEHPAVAGWDQADGNWGATVVRLKRARPA